MIFVISGDIYVDYHSPCFFFPFNDMGETGFLIVSPRCHHPDLF